VSWRRHMARFSALFGRRGDDLDEEIRSHLDLEVQENIEAGLSQEEARYAALRRFGNVTLVREASREMWRWHSVETLLQDVRYGLRQLKRGRGFTVAAILTLALGIGANTAVFSLANILMFRPLPVKDAARLVVVAVQDRADADPGQLSYLDYLDYRSQSDVFSDMTFYDLDLAGLGSRGHTDRIVMAYVPSNFFSMLGLRPAAGRLIVPGEGDEPNTGPVVVLGNGYWRRRFDGDSSVIGRSVTLNGAAVTVIGVVPADFVGPYNIVELDAYVPIGIYGMATGDSDLLGDRRDAQLHVLATLKPGVTAKRAEAALNVIAERLAKAYPEADQGQIARVIPERLARPEPGMVNFLPLATSIFLTMVALVLLVACFNVANLLLARGAAREREIAVRAALGASRLRLIRQMLTECLLLAMAAAVGGALLGIAAIRGLEKLHPLGDLALRLPFTFDWRVFSFVAGVALAAGTVAGLAPALRVSRTNLNDALRQGGRGLVGDTRHQWLRSGLVVAQVAGSLIVLVAAGLFTRSLTNAESIDLGYDPHHVLNLSLDPELQGYDRPRAEAFFDELLRRARALPGVESASLAFSVPLGYYSDGTSIHVEGQPVSPGERTPSAGYNCVTPHYFSTMRMRILDGRGFSETDTATSAPVAIVNETMAERLWPNQEALGRRFSYDGAQGPFKSGSRVFPGSPVTVVGVVRNAKVRSLLDTPGNLFYVPQTQNYKSVHVLQLRTTVPPQSLIVPVEALVGELDPNLPVYDVMTMERALAGANGYFLFTLGAGFAGSLGALGLLLAVVGVYGVVSYWVSRREHEIGIRLALGARPRSVLALVFRQAGVVLGAGIAVGVVGALGVTRVLASLLIGVHPYDPLTFITVSALLLTVATAACYVPARRTTKIDPMAALRHD
jgi:putative ABC transport system permease protein